MRLALALLCPFVTVGCGRKTSESTAAAGSTVDAPFVSSADMVAESASLRALEANEVIAELQDTDAFYANRPDDGADAAASPAEGECVSSKLGSIRIAHVDQKLKGGGILDLSSCFDAAQFTALFTDVAMHVDGKFYFEIGCQGVDLAPFDGKSLADLSADQSIIGGLACSESSLLSNSSFDISFAGTLTFGGQSRRVEQNDVSTHFTGRSDGRPCTRALVDGVYQHADGCLGISRTLNKISRQNGIADASEGTIDLVRLESEGLSESQEGRPAYFSTGRYLVQLNDWNGEMTYSSASEAPTWTMSRGPESVTGAFDGGVLAGARLAEWLDVPQPGLRLKDLP